MPVNIGQAELDMYRVFLVKLEAYRLALKGHNSDVAELSLIAQDHSPTAQVG